MKEFLHPIGRILLDVYETGKADVLIYKDTEVLLDSNTEPTRTFDYAILAGQRKHCRKCAGRLEPKPADDLIEFLNLGPSEGWKGWACINCGFKAAVAYYYNEIE